MKFASLCIPLVLAGIVSCGSTASVQEAFPAEETYIGFGTSPKNELAFTVSEAFVGQTEEDLFDNIFDYLRGRGPGVIVASTSSVGEVPHIEIRGNRTMGTEQGEPLFLIDGMEYQDIQNLNPRDVHSVQVLKGAAASAYGSRGADGVIVFTTKAAHDAESMRTARNWEEKQMKKAQRKE